MNRKGGGIISLIRGYLVGFGGCPVDKAERPVAESFIRNQRAFRQVRSAYLITQNVRR